MYKIFKKLILILPILLVLLAPSVSFAFPDTKSIVPCWQEYQLNADGTKAKDPATSKYILISNHVVTDTVTGDKVCDATCPPSGCGWDEGVMLVYSIMNMLLDYLVLPGATAIFMYAGYLFMTSGSNPKKREEAKNVLKSVIIGLLVAASAWLIVNFILKSLNVNPDYIMLDQTTIQ